jgi:hypothetical protein
MGNDGRNKLEIRGDPAILKILANTFLRLRLDDVEHDPTLVFLAENYFGQGNLSVYNYKEGSNYLCVGYAFRNSPMYDYLKLILKKYPQLWMKNEYDSEEGYCGIWVARYIGKELDIQEVNWIEPCIEVLYQETDFSRGY